MAIQRQLTNERMSQIVTHNGTVYLSGKVGDDMNAEVEHQTRETLANIEHLLDLAGTDKSRILMVTIYITEIANKPEFNRAWDEWVDRENLPLCACIGAALENDDLVELVVSAAD